MRRFLFLALLVASACHPPAEEPRSTGADMRLDAPAPSSVTLAGLLSTANTGYDNVQQARRLQEESKHLGIATLDTTSEQIDENVGAPREAAPYDEVVAHTREMTRQIAAQRQAMDKGRPKPVGLDGSTPALIPGKPQGGPIEGGPKDLEVP